ncbi:hypothetical protein HJG60_008031 [Phyllostomus discolor]|uniref:LINE-1 type transposase domain-containing protein 1 n=1 Tax=Phyllostomus discolor TaxID=89673 RepID=A0A834BN73_9CHIR|nr:hypothetical protein HJG60_008031 [Phyllostomus discolor]
MKENLLNLEKEIDIQVQEAQRVPNKLDSKRSTPRHIMIKISKVKGKESILKAARDKQKVTYKVVPIRLPATFSKEICRQDGTGEKILKVMKSKDLLPRLLNPAKLSFRMEGQIKCFLDKEKLKEFIITTPLLHKMLKGLI